MIELEPSHKSQYTERDVIKVAATWRILVIILSMITFSVLGERDTSSESTLLEHDAGKISEGLLITFLRTFIKWDAVHMLGIAKNGYIFEQQFAFFPGLPYICKLFAIIIYPLTFYMSYPMRVAFAAIVLTNTVFVLATWMLYKTSCLLFDERFAWTSALMFTFTPTPGFMSSMYTEPYFAFLNFTGIYFFHKKSLWKASFSWTLAGIFRSNAILFIGYPIFNLFFLNRWTQKSFKKIIITVFFTVIQCIMILSPFFLFQYFGYVKFCKQDGNNYHWWCHEKYPSIYTYVQHHYWGSGYVVFFKHYDPAQTPYAAPFLLLAILGGLSYAWADLRRFLTIGIIQRKPKDSFNLDIQCSPETLKIPQQSNYHKSSILPHVYLWLVMAAFCYTSMYLPVILRFLTSMPAMYWFTAHLVKSHWIISYITIGYWTGYSLYALILFATHAPPA